MERHGRQPGWRGGRAAQCGAAYYEHGAARPQSSEPFRLVGRKRDRDLRGRKPQGAGFRRAGMGEMVWKRDAARPVGIACHTPETVSQAVYDPLDLTGWNYAHRYDNYRAMYPDKPILYSESASAFSTRGFYAFPVPNSKSDYSAGTQYLTSYDLNAAGYSDIADVEFALMEKDRFVAGEFVWTGFDYLGEPSPFVAEGWGHFTKRKLT